MDNDDPFLEYIFGKWSSGEHEEAAQFGISSKIHLFLVPLSPTYIYLHLLQLLLVQLTSCDSISPSVLPPILSLLCYLFYIFQLSSLIVNLSLTLFNINTRWLSGDPGSVQVALA